MMKFVTRCAAIGAALLAMPAAAVTITWSGLSDGALSGGYDEGGFHFAWQPAAYSQLLGGVRVVGNDPNLSSGNSATSFTVTRIGGGLFSFDSVAGANVNGTNGNVGNNDGPGASNYLVFGFLGGNQVAGQEITGGQDALVTAASQFSTLVDSIQVILGGGVFPTDVEAVTNLTLTEAQVPEPAMLGLFGLGAIGLGLTRRRKA